MRRLARAYQARLNFYVINRGELPDYEGTAPAVGRPVVGAVSALRAKQPMDFTFDAHSELSPEKLKEWIDLFLAGKLKKVRPGLLCQRGAARLSCPAAVSVCQARPSLEELPNCPTLRIDDKERALHLNDLAVRYQAVGNMELAVQQVRGRPHSLSLRLALTCALAPAARRGAAAGPCEPDLALQHGAGARSPPPPLTTHTLSWRAAVIRTGLQAREMMGEMEGAIAEYKLSLDNDIRYMDGTRTRTAALRSTPCG